MTEQTENSIQRQEYFDKVQELVDAGKLPKSYRSAVQFALAYVYKPNEGDFLATYEKYKRSIPNIPSSLRAEMDRRILDNLVSEKKLSGLARDNLLRELSSMRLRHGETNFDRIQREFDDADKEIDAMIKSTEALVQKAKESEFSDNIKAIGVLSVVAVVLIVAWKGFAGWVNTQSTNLRENTPQGTYGESGSREQFESELRDAANALYDKCSTYGSGYDARCN